MNSEKFWQFSLSLYGDPEVQQLCLSLQDEQGCNVNLLLFCFWLKFLQKSADVSLLQNLQNTIALQDKELKAFRLKRKAAKGQDEIYQSFKVKELMMEKMQQQTLVNHYNQIKHRFSGKSCPLQGFCLLYSLPISYVEALFIPLIMNI